jgi:regulator of protease activity HflC (stomatin/prohibitin superfamily)
MPDIASWLLPLIIALLVVIFVVKAIQFVPQARVRIVERLGKYRRTLDSGPHLVIPGIDKVRYTVDMREQVVSFPPQPVITKDNLVVSIDTVIYYIVTDPVLATYAVNNYLQAIEQLTMTQLRQVIGGMELETTLTSRERINGALASELDAATGKWGIKVKRVELKGIDPPASIQDSMEKQMRAERDKRATVLNAEGVRQSQVLTADGEKQGNILRAQGEREAMILRAQASREAEILKAQGQAQAISTVFSAIHAGRPDAELLSYQYLQMLPEIAKGDSNKLWIIPSELGKALEGLGGALGGIVPKAPQLADSDGSRERDLASLPPAPPPMPIDTELPEPDPAALEAANEVVKQAIAEAESSARMAGGSDATAQALLDAAEHDGVQFNDTGAPTMTTNTTSESS